MLLNEVCNFFNFFSFFVKEECFGGWVGQAKIFFKQAPLLSFLVGKDR
jgi:hypothetical protein